MANQTSDPEIAALRSVHRILLEQPQPARARILDWCNARFLSPVPCAPPPPVGEVAE